MTIAVTIYHIGDLKRGRALVSKASNDMVDQANDLMNHIFSRIYLHIAIRLNGAKYLDWWCFQRAKK